MDKVTRHYIKRQIERVEKPETEFYPTIKIKNKGMETNYISITFAELKKIKLIYWMSGTDVFAGDRSLDHPDHGRCRNIKLCPGGQPGHFGSPQNLGHPHLPDDQIGI